MKSTRPEPLSSVYPQVRMDKKKTDEPTYLSRLMEYGIVVAVTAERNVAFIPVDAVDSTNRSEITAVHNTYYSGHVLKPGLRLFLSLPYGCDPFG